MANRAWIEQQLDRMAAGITAGKTRKRAVDSVHRVGSDEHELSAGVRARGWKLAKVGDDYVVAPPDYEIRPIV